jgi:uncharacterized protein YcaQ
VLLSRLGGFDPVLAESLLQPGQPLFEYWGHEASWIPIELYPLFGFRRREFRAHPWWGDIISEHPDVADSLLNRIKHEGPLRSVDMEGEGSRGWWDLKVAKKVATALWSSGELAIRERRAFQRTYDLAERVIPDCWRNTEISEDDAIEALLLRALKGHGWASTATLTQTWRLKNRKAQISQALDRLVAKGEIIPCSLHTEDRRTSSGWIRPTDLQLCDRFERSRPRRDRGILLSPFDPILWDRNRVQQLFDFHQVLEIFKPAPQRKYGYYCLPVLAGDRLVARFDLKAHIRTGKLEVLSGHFEALRGVSSRSAEQMVAARSALVRFAAAVELQLENPVF